MKVRHTAVPVLLVVGLLAIWELAVRVGGVPSYILPAPTRIASTLVGQLPLLLHHAAATALELALGLLVAGVCGMGLAVAMAASRSLERALAPFLIASQMMPVFAIAPLLVVWLGYGILPKVVVAAIIGFFPVAVSVRDGLRSASTETRELLVSMGASRVQLFTKLLFPASLPSLFSGLKVSATLCVVGATIGEWVGARRGLGFLMLEANARLRVDLVFASIVVLSLVALSLFVALRIIERRVVHWRGTRSGG